MTPTDKQELLPCPFCGEEAEVERLGTSRASMVVVCSSCGAKVECGATCLSNSIWNTRQLPDQASAGDGWISVEDRLPEIEQDVLIAYSKKNRSVVGKRRSSVQKGDYFVTVAWNVGAGDVTHWRPIPNPPSDKTGK